MHRGQEGCTPSVPPLCLLFELGRIVIRHVQDTEWVSSRISSGRGDGEGVEETNEHDRELQASSPEADGKYRHSPT